MIFANRELAKRLDTAEALQWFECVHSYTKQHPGTDVFVQPIADGQAIFNRQGSIHMHALALGLERAVTSDELDALEAFYRARAVAPTIELCPLAEASFVTLLGDRGYRLTEFVNVLFLELDSAISGPSRSEVEVREAGENEAELWAQTVADGFSDEEEMTSIDREILAIFPSLPTTTCFLGLVGGEIAGAAAVYRRDGVGMLLRASTLPAFRRRGVHTALMGTRLTWARSHGCDVAMTVSLSSSHAHQNAERMGFSTTPPGS